MANRWQGGFLRDDATGALAVSGGTGSSGSGVARIEMIGDSRFGVVNTGAPVLMAGVGERVSRALNATWVNGITGGSYFSRAGTDSSSWNGYPTRRPVSRRITAPYGPTAQVICLNTGYNDFTNNSATLRITSALEAVICQWRAASKFTAADALVSITGGAPATDARTDNGFLGQSGDYADLGAAGQHVNFTVPADYNGTEVCFYFANTNAANSEGGVINFTVNGVSAGSLDTRTISVDTTYGYAVKRLTATGGDAIVATLSASSPAVTHFNSITLTATSSPLILICNQATIPAGSTFSALNTALATTVAGFDSQVQLFDVNAVLTGHSATAWMADGIHYNDYGSALIADAIVTAIESLSVNGTTVTIPDASVWATS